MPVVSVYVSVPVNKTLLSKWSLILRFLLRSAACVPKESCTIKFRVEMNTGELIDRRRNASEVDSDTHY